MNAWNDKSVVSWTIKWIMMVFVLTPSAIAMGTTFGPHLESSAPGAYPEKDANVQGDYIYFSRPIQVPGSLKQWKFELNYDDVPADIPVIQMALRLYRPRELMNENHKEFEIVWEKIVEFSRTEPVYQEMRATRQSLLKTVELTDVEQPQVSPGDFIGWSYLNTAGVIPFKWEASDFVGENWNRWRSMQRFGEQHWRVGTVVSFFNGADKDFAGFDARRDSFRFVPGRQYGINVEIDVRAGAQPTESTGYREIPAEGVFPHPANRYTEFDHAMQSDYLKINQPIKSAGRIRSWKFLLGHVPELQLPTVTEIRFRVYRPHYHHNGRNEESSVPQYELIGENKFRIRSTPHRRRVIEWAVPESQQIQVQPGDLIGWTNFNSFGVIAYFDAPTRDPHLVLDNLRRWREFMGRHNPQHRMKSNEPHWTVGDIVSVRSYNHHDNRDDAEDLYVFTPRGYREYALTVDIDDDSSERSPKRARLSPAQQHTNVQLVGNSIEGFQTIYANAETDAAVQGDYILLNRPIHMAGRIVEWNFLVDTNNHDNQMEGHKLIMHARVYRRVPSVTQGGAREYVVIGANSITIEKNQQGQLRKRVPEGEQIQVQPGDLIGWSYHNSRGLIPFKPDFESQTAENPTRWREGHYIGGQHLRVGSRVTVMPNDYHHMYDHTFRVYSRYYPFQAGIVPN